MRKSSVYLLAPPLHPSAAEDSLLVIEDTLIAPEHGSVCHTKEKYHLLGSEINMGLSLTTGKTSETSQCPCPWLSKHKNNPFPVIAK